MNSKIILGVTAAVCSLAVAAWEIVLPEKAVISEQTAAKELKSYLEKSTSSLTVGKKGFFTGAKEAVFHVGDTAFARKNGMRSLRDDAIRKAEAGISTLEEVIFVTLRDEN